ncbi:hypothetical protein PENSPDRAFT_754482 [Peniophora sp. CONT]|nr:hypothetical protein PENSPDRAFT_754482 [Peniophora sp. CONT]
MGDSDNWQEDARAFWWPLVDARFAVSQPQVKARSRVESRVESLDSEILVLQNAVYRARKLRNLNAGVGRLPAEVLLTTFLFVRDDWLPERHYNPASCAMTYRSGWMTLTHVCSGWREIAVGAPALWTAQDRILETPVYYIPTILSRARNCLLDMKVYFWDGDDEFEEDVSQVLNWLCRSVCLRLESLHLEGLPLDLLLRVLSHISPYLPNLREFHAETRNYEDGPTIELPSKLSDISTIRDLSLSGFSLPWHAAIFSHCMTDLHLHVSSHGFDTQPQRPTHAQYKGFLDAMPSLRRLTLANVIPSDSADEELHLPPNLEFFEFTSYSDDMAEIAIRLLAQIRFPNACTRVATVLHDWEDSEESNPFTSEAITRCASAFTCIGADSHATPRELVYARDQVTMSMVEHDMEVSPHGRANIHPNVLYDSWRSRTDGQYSHLNISNAKFACYLQHLNLSDLRAITLSLHACNGWTDEQWSSLGTCAPCVRRVGISLIDCLHLLHNLADFADETFALFPLLEVLVFHGPIGDEQHEKTLFSELTALTHLLYTRMDKGAPLSEVVMCKKAERWGVWDTLKGVVRVRFL